MRQDEGEGEEVPLLPPPLLLRLLRLAPDRSPQLLLVAQHDQVGERLLRNEGVAEMEITDVVVVLAERITTVIGMFLEQKIAMNILCSPKPMDYTTYHTTLHNLLNSLQIWTAS